MCIHEITLRVYLLFSRFFFIWTYVQLHSIIMKDPRLFSYFVSFLRTNELLSQNRRRDDGACINRSRYPSLELDRGFKALVGIVYRLVVKRWKKKGREQSPAVVLILRPADA